MLLRKKKAQQLHFFVSIGSGLNQIPLIREANDLGLHVIGVDANVSAPGFYQCDLKIQESIENYNAIYKKLLELLVDGEIHGIMTKSYGMAIMTASYLNERFKVSFLPFSMSDCFVNKTRMRTVLAEHNIRMPRSIPPAQRSRPDRIPPDTFPVIIKPVYGHAKTDVRMARDQAEMKKILGNPSLSSANCIIEKFVDGDEIIAAGLVHQGKYYLVELTDKKTSFPPYFIDILHTAPSKHLDLSGTIEGIGQSVADAFGIVTSPLIMEFVIDSEGNPYLIEAVPEFGGEFIPDVLIPASANYNIIRESIKSMTGLGFRPPQPPKHRKAVVVRYVTGRDGILASCNPEGPRHVQGTIFSRIFKEIGSQVIDPVTNHDRIGVVVAEADTVEDALALTDEAALKFNIRIK
ncbi:MAG: ATP-grasp domain-containing protein [Spirochaetes bacterium]|nr:ATP-grasp domain-containing protein [Spirochaetota bacterium]